MDIIEIFYRNRNEELAIPMAKYMKNLFPFLGMKKPESAKLARDFLREKKKKDKEVDWDFIWKCFNLPEREFQYLAIDYMERVKDLFTPEDMKEIERLITTKSWWDSVDAINKVVGHIVMKYPELKEGILLEWINSDNIWLKRISIIFQLKYKERTDRKFLKKAILTNCQTDEFFVDKAIGWALREYSKTNKEWVRDFIDSHRDKLSKLSIREASKYL